MYPTNPESPRTPTVPGIKMPTNVDYRRWAADLDLPAHLKSVLNALVAHAWDSPDVGPSQAKLAKITGKTARNVQKNLADLRDRGVIEIMTTYTVLRNRQSTNTYRLKYVDRWGRDPYAGFKMYDPHVDRKDDTALCRSADVASDVRGHVAGDVRGHVAGDVPIRSTKKPKHLGGTLPPNPLRQPGTAPPRPVFDHPLPQPSDAPTYAPFLRGDHRPPERERTPAWEWARRIARGIAAGATVPVDSTT